jgi:hypothetical protein
MAKVNTTFTLSGETTNYESDLSITVFLDNEDEEGTIRRRLVMNGDTRDSHLVIALEGIALELSEKESLFAKLVGKSTIASIEKSLELIEKKRNKED